MRARTDRFEGPTEQGRLILIFPLSGGRVSRLEPADGSVNGCRLGPPESVRTGRNRFPELWLRKTTVLRSERKRRLSHNFSCQKMRPECTIFPYGANRAFLGKSTIPARQFRRPYSSLRPEGVNNGQKVSKGHLLTVPARSDEWGRLNLTGKARENTRKHGKHEERVNESSHPVVLL